MFLGVIGYFCLLLAAQDGKPAESAKSDPAPTAEAAPAEAAPAESNKRVELNLLGKTDTSAGESRRNENVQFNLVDNNALKELNTRLGTTATIIQEFRPEGSYFGAEFGKPPGFPIHVPPTVLPAIHGAVHLSHLNSLFSARAFFQAGPVKPARENDYGFRVGTPVWRGASVLVDAAQQKLRGSVNGNVLVPKPDERTPLTTDPATRAIVESFLAAYPRELPNRTDIDPRALNTNAPQVINNNYSLIRLDQALGSRDRLTFLYSFTAQAVDAFQLVAGQNPDTDTKSHDARITWTRQWDSATVSHFSAGYSRVTSWLRAEPNAVGPYVTISSLDYLGPLGNIPIDRALNQFRYAGQLRRTSGGHNWSAGFGALRRQLNGIETDSHRGFFNFANDFGRDSITNLRMGIPNQYIISLGDIHRGFRNWDLEFYAGDSWRVSQKLTLNYGLRFQPVTRPVEVNNLNDIGYRSDWNNFAPQVGFAYRMPGGAGVMRAAYSVQYGEIFPVTFQQVRFTPPGNYKIAVPAPNLVDPLHAPSQDGSRPEPLPNLYLMDPELATPYSHQYNFTWEPDWSKTWKLQLGYVGSRSHQLLIMWYTNRAQPVPGIPQTTDTINLRRPIPKLAEIRRVLNGSRGYYDAARVSLIIPRWHGVSSDVAYWFGKAMDLGSSYTNTAYDNDSRFSRSQWEYETHADMKGLSTFDQKHAFLWRTSYLTPKAPGLGRLERLVGQWNLGAIVLLKSGTPFSVHAGADGPGYGNVDGNGNDRPNLLDPAVLGRTIGDPDTSRSLLPMSAFAFIAPDASRGNLGRTTFRKGSIGNVNASLSRDFPIRREKRLTFRAESINFFNTPQFADPCHDMANFNFGQITNTLNDGRSFRFAVEFAW